MSPEQAPSRPGTDWRRRSPSPVFGQLTPASNFDQVEELVRSGIDSGSIAVVGDADPDRRRAIMQHAEEGRAAGRGPLPLQPHDLGLRSLVVLPTYDERENLEAMVADIRAYLATDILVVDDASPDGTGELADSIAARDPAVSVLHRSGKLGLGTAYIAGFRHAIEHGYERVFEMDCDFSHPPWDLPRLAAASRRAALVIGSRYVRGGSTIGWDAKRRLLSRGANLYARTVLGLGVRDSTAGFRCYDVGKLGRLDLSQVGAEGYAFQVEMAYRMQRAGFDITELPIHFTDRRVGASKMDGKVAREALVLVPALRFKVRSATLLRSDS